MPKALLVFVMLLAFAGMAFAEAFDATKGGTEGVPANAWGPYTVTYNLDVDKFTDGDGFTAADTLDVIKIPKGAVVYGVNFKVLEGDALATCTVDVGDSASAVGFLENATCGTSATTDSFSLTYGGTAGKSYASGGKVRVTFDHNATTLKAAISAVIMPFRN